MKKEAFTFDDVRIAPDRQIGCHSHSQWEISMVICGAGVRTVGNFSEPISEGEIIVIPPHIPHVWNFDPRHTDADGCIANISIFFETPTLEALFSTIPELRDSIDRLRNLSHAVRLTGADRDRVKESLISMRGMEGGARAVKMIQMLDYVSEADLSAGTGRHAVLSRLEERLEKVRIYCKCNYARGITLDELSAYVGMSKSSFCTFMKRQTGRSLSEYVNGVRLDRARDLLTNTDKAIKEIAFEVGYSNVSYFNRLFRQQYQCSPKSLRPKI